MEQKKTRLPNGLTVITVEKPYSYTVATGISVNAGSFNETGFPAGTAHFLEHMLFKETTSQSNKEINNAINSVGGELNAFTYYEETKYYAVTPKLAWEVGLDLLMDVVANNTLPEDELDKERNVIFEEIKMDRDDPMSMVLEALQRRMMEGYPERLNILGNEESVSNITREDLIRFRNTYYHPENLTLVVAGAVTHEAVLEKVKGFTVDYPKLPATTKRPFVQPELTGSETLLDNAEQSYFNFALFGPDMTDSRSAAFEVLSVVLGGNESSRLFTKIREDRGIAYMIATNTEYLSDYGAMYGIIGTGEEHFDELEEIIDAEMTNIANEGISDEELIQARAFLMGRAMMEFESNLAINDYITGAIIYNQPTDPQAYIEELEKLTLEDVKELAAEYLTLDNYFTLKLISDEEDGMDEAV